MCLIGVGHFSCCVTGQRNEIIYGRMLVHFDCEILEDMELCIKM